MGATTIQVFEAIMLMVLVLAILAALATTFGADSRHGFGDDVRDAPRPDLN